MKRILAFLTTFLLTQQMATAGGRPLDAEYFARVFWVLPLLALALLGLRFVVPSKLFSILVFLLAVANLVFCLVVGIGRPPAAGDSRDWRLVTNSTFLSAVLLSILLAIVGMSGILSAPAKPKRE
jgi:hypothetical protein